MSVGTQWVLQCQTIFLHYGAGGIRLGASIGAPVLGAATRFNVPISIGLGVRVRDGDLAWWPLLPDAKDSDRVNCVPWAWWKAHSSALDSDSEPLLGVQRGAEVLNAGEWCRDGGCCAISAGFPLDGSGLHGAGNTVSSGRPQG